MAFHSLLPSGPSASKQLPASCSALDHGADPAATTHSGSVSSSFASPNAFRVPGATWISSGVASPMPSMRNRKPPLPTYFDNTTPPEAVAVTTTSSLLTKRAGNCQHLSLNNATSLRGLSAATHPAASASVDAANLTVPRAVLTENWCGRSLSPLIRRASWMSAQFTPPRSLPRIRESSRDGSAHLNSPASIQQKRSAQWSVAFCFCRRPRRVCVCGMGVAGSLVAGVLKVLLLDVRRPKLGKLKGLFFFCGGSSFGSATQCLVWCLWLLPRAR
mmetsp:Transcript_22896/g.59813  ORF Transcript_22896/g.59813 Transcript_22896/m.59813 type:complete len:274 (+) Transcript_22896:2481-3302(+)